MLWLIIKTTDVVRDVDTYSEYLTNRYGGGSIKVLIVENGVEGRNPHFNYIVETYNNELPKTLRTNMLYHFQGLKEPKKLCIKAVDNASGLMVYLQKEDNYVEHINLLFTAEEMAEFKRKSYKGKKNRVLSFTEQIVKDYIPLSDEFDKEHILWYILDKYGDAYKPFDEVIIKRIYFAIRHVNYRDRSRKDIWSKCNYW